MMRDVEFYTYVVMVVMLAIFLITLPALAERKVKSTIIESCDSTGHFNIQGDGFKCERIILE